MNAQVRYCQLVTLGCVLQIVQTGNCVRDVIIFFCKLSLPVTLIMITPRPPLQQIPHQQKDPMTPVMIQHSNPSKDWTTIPLEDAEQTSPRPQTRENEQAIPPQTREDQDATELLVAELSLDADVDARDAKLQKTWQFDACPRPLAMDEHPVVTMPSLLVFLDIVSHLLLDAGEITHAVDANQLLHAYRAKFDENPTFDYFFNSMAHPCLRICVKNDGVRVVCRTRNADIQLTPVNTFGVAKFVTGKAYTVTREFSTRFLQSKRLVVYSNTQIQRPMRPKQSPSQARLTGETFDTYFPTIPQPARLAEQFSPPLPPTIAEVHEARMSGTRRVFTGYLTFVISTGKGDNAAFTESIRSGQWAGVTPRYILGNGTFTQPAFNPSTTLPSKEQMKYMCKLFVQNMTRRRQVPNSTRASSTKNKKYVSGWLFHRAYKYAQEVKRYYKIDSVSSYLVEFKVLCVAWQLLQVFLRDSPSLYALLLRSFCYASSHQIKWVCFHQTQQMTKVRPVSPSYPMDQQWVTWSQWDLSANPKNERWIAALQKLCAGFMGQPKTQTHRWWYMCPLTVFQEDFEHTRIKIGPSFKVR